MMKTLIPLLIIAAGTAEAQENRHPDAVEIFHCTFGPEWDANFDDWPDHWIRKEGVDYPHYLKLLIADDPSAVEGRSLKLAVDGGAAEVASPPILVDARFSYVLLCRLKTGGLHHDRAYVSVTFYDADRQPLETVTSEKFRDAPEWTQIRIGPFSPRGQESEVAVVSFHVEPGVREDLTGWAKFDDVWFARLPRMHLSTNSAYNVYTDPGDVRVTCRLSGVVERDPEIRFELLDASSQSIARTNKRVDGELIAQKSSKASDLLGQPEGKPAGYAGTTDWQPPIEDYGFYRVRVTMRSPNGIMHERQIAVAIIRPLGKVVRGEFGWSMPKGDKPLGLDPLVGLVEHVGISWLKFPVWYQEDDERRGDQLMWFAERLGSKGIEMVGMLDHPPADVMKHFGDDEQISAANVFSADPSFWFPSLDPVMTRLSLKIRWWQLGDDRDTSFVGYPNLSEKIRQTKRQLYRFGQEAHLGIGWRWLAETLPDPSPPWEFLAMSADPPLTGAEMATYLKSGDGKTARRWALIEPLPRGEYSMETRARDLVDQMMSAKIQQADGVFVSNTFDHKTGLMNPDGTPGELLLPWRTTALLLGGANYLGSIRMPHGSHNHVFTRDGEAVMVVWNEQPVEEVIYLGEDIRQIDIWGRMALPQPPADGDHRQVIRVGTLPTFITGINEQVTRWRMAVRFEDDRVPSVFGKAHRNGIHLQNFFNQGAGGEIRLVTPDVWDTYPREMTVKLAAGESLVKPFEVELKLRASSGKQVVRIDFDINVDRRYRFSAYRDLEVGLGDVIIDVATELDENGVLVVEQRMTNLIDNLVDFKCLLYAPNRRRQSNQVFRLGRGEDIKRYRFPDGRELIGEELWLRAEEIGGSRILNYRFEAKE